MKNYVFFLIVLILVFSSSCKKNQEDKTVKSVGETAIPELKLKIDSTVISKFYKQYPKLVSYQDEVQKLYQSQTSNQIWLDSDGISEYGYRVFNKYRNIEDEGLPKDFAYNDVATTVFEKSEENKLSKEDTDILISNLYVYYTQKVYGGLDKEKVQSLNWFLPKKSMNYEAFTDSIFNEKKASKDSIKMFSQYYKLKNELKRYRKIEQNGGWRTIEISEDFKGLKVGDSSEIIQKIRNRLFISGELKSDSKSAICDSVLLNAVQDYQIHHGNYKKNIIVKGDIDEMNVPIGDRIKTLIVNMERCRWIDPELEKQKEYLEVNIPEFKLYMIRDGKISFISPVVVGKALTKTVIFSGMMRYIVFSPYWGVPQSIVNKEIKPGLARDKRYLAKRNLEWSNGQVRQLPGKNNSLGLVKFLFPNSNNIYLHDTPTKSLFEKDSRAYSHGCVRVGKPRELAIELLKGDPNWSPERIDKAMHGGKEKWVTLKNKIPVYIGYFTAWVDRSGNLNFYDDVYKRDEHLAKLIYNQ